MNQTIVTKGPMAGQGQTLSGALLVIMMSVGCSSTRLGPQRESIQAQCGVQAGLQVSREQATCIAKFDGLKQTALPWTITEYHDRDLNEPMWCVTATFDPPILEHELESERICISQRDGRVWVRLKKSNEP